MLPKEFCKSVDEGGVLCYDYKMDTGRNIRIQNPTTSDKDNINNDSAITFGYAGEN